MKAAGDAAWRDLGASAALHGMAAGLVLALATSGGPGVPDVATGSVRGGFAGTESPQVLGVALLGSQGNRAKAGTPPASEGPHTEDARGPRPVAPGPKGSFADASSATTTAQAEASAPAAPPTSPAEIAQAGPGDAGEMQTGQGDDGIPGEQGAGSRAVGAGGSGSEGKAARGAAVARGGPSDVTAPAPLHFAVPALPRGVKPSDTHGARARLLLYVTESGEVREVKLLSGTRMPPLDESAVEAGYRMRYRPGTRNGVPAAMWTEAEVLF